MTVRNSYQESNILKMHFASLRLCAKLGSQRRRDAKCIKDKGCEKYSTTNLFCQRVLVTDSDFTLNSQQGNKLLLEVALYWQFLLQSLHLSNNSNSMNKTLFLLFIFFCNTFYSQTKLLSWNLENFGKSKSNQEIAFVANIIKDFDIVTIQEVVAGNGGSQAVAQLASELNQKGSKWDYRISDPTSSSAHKTERYAFLWKTKTIKLKGRPWLEQKFHLEIDREPYFATFEIEGKNITIASFHAITKSKQPETEIKYFKFLPQEYPKLNLLFTGDFNCPQSHSVFNPLKKMGYVPILRNQKTSLKIKSKGDSSLASEFDNMFYKNCSVNYIKSDVILFYKKFISLKEARRISDHIPIWVEFSLN